MNAHQSLILIIPCLLLNLFSVKGLSTNETEASRWFKLFDEEYRQFISAASAARWTHATDVRPATEKADIEAWLKLCEFRRRKRIEMYNLFNWTQFKDKRLKRMFSKAADIGISIETDSAKLTMFAQLLREISHESIQGLRKLQHPEAVYIFRKMGDPSITEAERKQMWQRWRNATGKPVRAMYQRFVDLANEMIKQAGYDNYAQYWQSQYEPKPGQNFEKKMADIFEELLPFYKELHGYMRHALKQKYPASVFPPTGQIPAHILGDVFGANWYNLESSTRPFPNGSTIDITDEMIKKNWTVKKIFETSDDFFLSLGLGKMTKTFWQNSIMERLPGVRMNCYTSVFDFYTNASDFRIKQCTLIHRDFIAATHHEMGHIQYYKQYENQPVVFREAVNRGFYEAIANAIELSVMTPSHLRKLGLFSSDSESNELYINYLYLMALKNVVIPPHDYLVDHWRNKVFKGEVPKDQLNTEWVNLQCKLLGVSSPVLRSEKDFDPGADHHVGGNFNYMSFFIGMVLEFQFHQSLCNAAGVAKDFHKCSIYNSSAAGGKLKAFLEKGSSVHWEDALFELSGTRIISAQPLLDYFEPLRKHIREVNAKNGVKVGWDDKCPSADWYTKSDQRLSTSLYLGNNLHFSYLFAFVFFLNTVFDLMDFRVN